MIEHLIDSVRVTADDGTVGTFTTAEFAANPSACVAATGNGISEPVPTFVTRGQFKILFNQVGHLANIKSILAKPSTPLEAVAAFEDEPYIYRDSPGLDALRILAEFTDTQMDDFFRTASKIKV